MSYAETYLWTNGVKVDIGYSQRFLESKFGIPQHETKENLGWELENGNSLSVKMGEEGLERATLSGTNPADYIVFRGQKFILNQISVSELEHQYQGYGCYYDFWYEGLIGNYDLLFGPEGSMTATFSFRSDAEQPKQSPVTSFTIGFDYEDAEPKECQ